MLIDTWLVWKTKEDERQVEIMKEIPLGDGLTTKVDDEDYEWLNKYKWYAFGDRKSGKLFAAHDRPDGKRVFMHNVIMGLDTLEDEPMN